MNDNIPVSMVCRNTGQGQTTCTYGRGPKGPQVAIVLAKAKQHYYDSLREPQTDALANAARARMQAAMSHAEKLGVIRDVIREKVHYLDDPPGLDTIQTLGFSLRRGAGDCVSLTIAVSALCKKIFGTPGAWRIGGNERDPFEHIWNIHGGQSLDASDPMPRAGEEFNMARKQNVAGISAAKLNGQNVLKMFVAQDPDFNTRELAQAGKNLNGFERALPKNNTSSYVAKGEPSELGALLGSFIDLPDMPLGVSGRAGVGNADPVAYMQGKQRWPESRKEGLTYGEVQSIEQWLRDYGLPAFTDKQMNSRNQIAWQAVYTIMARWNNLKLARQDEFFEAYRLHLTMFGWDPAKGLPNAIKGYAIGWPITRVGASGRSGTVASKLAGIGEERWLRYVAAMAISRDLFAEAEEEVGGVQPGLTDTIEDVQLSGVAVTGRWESLAGVWRWKGYDVAGRPLNQSEPLFAKPKYPPGEQFNVQRYNGKILLYLLTLPGVKPKFDAAAQKGVPILVSKYNARAKITRGAAPIESQPPKSGVAYAALLALFFTTIGIDLRGAFGTSFENLKPQIDKMPEALTALTIQPSTPEGVSGRRSRRPQGVFTALARS